MQFGSGYVVLCLMLFDKQWFMRINVSGSLREYFPLFLWYFVLAGLWACSVVSLGVGVLGCGDTPVNVVSLVVSFGGRGARLWRHPGYS